MYILPTAWGICCSNWSKVTIYISLRPWGSNRWGVLGRCENISFYQ